MGLLAIYLSLWQKSKRDLVPCVCRMISKPIKLLKFCFLHQVAVYGSGNSHWNQFSSLFHPKILPPPHKIWIPILTNISKPFPSKACPPVSPIILQTSASKLSPLLLPTSPSSKYFLHNQVRPKKPSIMYMKGGLWCFELVKYLLPKGRSIIPCLDMN